MKTFFLFLFSILFLSAQSQTQFITKGKIIYEKKTNQHKPLEEDEDNKAWYEEIIKQIPKMVTDIYEIKFDDKKSVYKLTKENTDNKYWFFKPNESDMVVTDFTTNTLSIQKDIFENTYLVKDSTRNLVWRITDEHREIAGFDCKKALTKICDSVVVVAFYTDQIPVSAGPESFGGLPGMIMGLAIPRMYATWFATKLELIEPTIPQLNPNQKGKKVNFQQLNVELKKGMKDWGKNGHRILWYASL
ncbi:MAG: GLPGLI family protein [Chitinophagaceae bacterium]|nr:GLPGLI family protein [Chitinophagaceae bacterium]